MVADAAVAAVQVAVVDRLWPAPDVDAVVGATEKLLFPLFLCLCLHTQVSGGEKRTRKKMCDLVRGALEIHLGNLFLASFKPSSPWQMSIDILSRIRASVGKKRISHNSFRYELTLARPLSLSLLFLLLPEARHNPPTPMYYSHPRRYKHL